MKGQRSFQMGTLDNKEKKRKLETLARNLKTFYAKHSFSEIFIHERQ